VSGASRASGSCWWAACGAGRQGARAPGRRPAAPGRGWRSGGGWGRGAGRRGGSLGALRPGCRAQALAASVGRLHRTATRGALTWCLCHASGLVGASHQFT
jgi:hypothetical protein